MSQNAETYPKSITVSNSREHVAVQIVLAALRKHDFYTTWFLWPKFLKSLMTVLIDMDTKGELVGGEVILRNQGPNVYKFKRAGIKDLEEEG